MAAKQILFYYPLLSFRSVASNINLKQAYFIYCLSLRQNTFGVVRLSLTVH